MKSKTKVFISYAREDEKIARKLYDDLKKIDVAPWMDTEDILPGQPWKVVISQAIKDSSFFLALLSSNSVSKKGFVQKELKTALDLLDEFEPHKVFVIPARLDNCNPSHQRLHELQWVDLFPNYEKGLDKILRALELEENNAVPSDSIISSKGPRDETPSVPFDEPIPVENEVRKTELTIDSLGDKPQSKLHGAFREDQDRYVASDAFFLFQDETLRGNACQAVEKFLETHTPVDKAQIHSIPVVIQAAGLVGFRDLAENQIKKNTKEKNKEFWTFILSLLQDMPGITRPEFALHASIQKERKMLDLLQDESTVSEKPKQSQIKRANKKIIEMVMQHALATYFEHFNCHYFYMTAKGGIS